MKKKTILIAALICCHTAWAEDPPASTKSAGWSWYEQGRKFTEAVLTRAESSWQSLKKMISPPQPAPANPQATNSAKKPADDPSKQPLNKNNLPLPATSPSAEGIARLNVPAEPKISTAQFEARTTKQKLVSKKNTQALPSPELVRPEPAAKVIPAKANAISLSEVTKKLNEVRNLQNRVVTLEKVRGIGFQIKEPQPITELAYNPLTINEIRILAALILVARGDQCHVAAGLLYDLRDDQKLKGEANYHLARCSTELGLTSQYVSSLIKVIESEDPEFLPKMLTRMEESVPYHFEVPVGRALSRIKNKSLIPAAAASKVNYLIAKSAARTGAYQVALSAAKAVPRGYSKYPEARYILATAQYATGQTKASLETQEQLLQAIEKDSSRGELKTLLQMNLGRVAYQDRQYNKAKEYFLKIDKNHPLWIEALMEQGWAQLQAGDVGGAIGNMYSVHSPFFRNIYIPESYVIRTIGYLNLCQYGDAYKSLSMLEHNYRPWLKAMESYESADNHGDHYDTVRKYLKSASNTDVDGLPYQVIREMARQKAFINQQKSINTVGDEIAQYKHVENILVSDKVVVSQSLAAIKNKLVDLKKGLEQSKSRGEPADTQARWQSLYDEARHDESFYYFRLDTQLDSRKAFAQMRERNSQEIDRLKSQLKAEANQILKRNFEKLQRNLAQALDNNELLRYEVFAGSGENLRYQAAGGAVNRVPASTKPTAKNLQWDFDGEFWADEIGNYRSTLANNCPDNQRKKMAGGE